MTYGKAIGDAFVTAVSLALFGAFTLAGMIIGGVLTLVWPVPIWAFALGCVAFGLIGAKLTIMWLDRSV